MKREARPAAAVAVALACVLTGGLTAVAGGAARRPSALPAQGPGHPGNPVVIRDAAFSVTGKAGTLVHVRLRTPLDAPHPADARRFTFTTTGEYGALTLRPEPGRSGPSLEAAVTTPAFACGRGDCPDAALVTSSPPDGQIPAGDYVLALGGPPGATLSYTLRGFEGTEPVTTVRGLYAVPYDTHRFAPGQPVTAPLYQTGRDRWTRPTIGHRMLAGVVLAVHPTQGGGYSFALCPGSYGSHSAQADTVSTARPTCSGYASVLGNVVGKDPLAHPLPGTGGEYAQVSFASANGTYEGVTGASYAVQCNQPPCGYTAAAYVLALDS
jgi:hypothetical protein